MLFILFFSGSKCTGMETLDHIVGVFRARDGEQTLQAAGAEQALAEKDEGKKKEVKAKLITFAWRGLFLFVSSLGKKKMEEKTAYFRGEEGRNSKKLCLPLSG